MASRTVTSDLSSVIKSHSETRTLEELAAQGKRKVRVVSSQKVMRIIQAIVDDTIAQETHEQVRRDRDQIVSETRGQFERVMNIQGEQESVIREQKELVRKYREQAESLADRNDRLAAQLEEERDGWAERETCLVSGYREKIAHLESEHHTAATRFEGERGELAGRQEQAVVESQRRIAELEEARESACRREDDARELSLVSERSLNRAEAKLAAVEATSQGQDQEIRRLSDRLDDAVADAVKRESVLSRRYEERIALLQEERRELEVRLEEERGRVAGRSEQATAELLAAEKKAGRVEARLATATELIARHEEEIHRLTGDLEAEHGHREESGRLEQAIVEANRRIDELVAQRDEARDASSESDIEVRRTERKLRRMQVRQTTARSQIEEHEREVARLTDELSAADLAVREAHEEAETRVQCEVGELKELLSSIAERKSGPDEATLEALVGRLSERETELEGRLNVQLDRTVDEITRSLHRATAGPIEVVGEATDVLVGRIFDSEHEMTSNLDSLEVQEIATKSGVSNSIARLRAARGKDTSSES